MSLVPYNTVLENVLRSFTIERERIRNCDNSLKKLRKIQKSDVCLIRELEA